MTSLLGGGLRHALLSRRNALGAILPLKEECQLGPQEFIAGEGLARVGPPPTWRYCPLAQKGSGASPEDARVRG